MSPTRSDPCLIKVPVPLDMLEVFDSVVRRSQARFRTLFPARSRHDSVIQFTRGIEVSGPRPGERTRYGPKRREKGATQTGAHQGATGDGGYFRLCGREQGLACVSLAERVSASIPKPRSFCRPYAG